MLNSHETALKGFLIANGVTQGELARGIEKSAAFISQLVNGDTGASQQTIDATLAFLSDALGRRVTYEEVFGAPDAPPVVAAEPEAGR